MFYPRTSTDNREITAWIIDERTSHGAVEKLKELIRDHDVLPSDYTYATVLYDCADSQYDANAPLESFSLHFGSIYHSVPMIFIRPLRAGHGNIEPMVCFKCLQLMGFLNGKTINDCPELFKKTTEDSRPLSFYK